MSIKTDGLLTIIVPCFNAEKYLDRCFSSLEGINDKLVQILFINDGSDDATKELIEEWTKRHNNSILISKKNGGYSSAINKGLDNSDSEYVMVMGVDDELIASGINKICSILQDKQPDILAFSTRKIYDDSQGNIPDQTDNLTVYNKPGYYKKNAFDLFKLIGNESRILYTRDTSRCFKKSVIGNLRYFGSSGVSADGCFSSLVACKSQSFEFVNETCYLWHLHRDSVSGRHRTKKRLIDEAGVWEKYFKELENLMPTTMLPDPTISHIFVYRNIIKELYDENEYEIARYHENFNRDITIKLKKSRQISFKSFIKLSFPNVYTNVLKIMKKKLVNVTIECL